MKKSLKILYIFILGFLSIWLAFHPIKTETNILKAIAPANSDIVTLSSKYSSKINVIIEGESPEEVLSVSDEFEKNLDKSYLKSLSSDKIFDIYKSHYSTLLSKEDRELLLNNNINQIKNNSLEKLYNPFFIPLLSLNDDPYLFFTDFINDLYQNNEIIEYENKYYKILNFDLSPALSNKEVKKIVDLSKKYPVYMTGAPIHSYYASSRSIVEVNIISILSVLFIIGMCIYYFRTPKILFLTGASLLSGYLSGFLVTGLIWKDIHILTFVFSATLIGICIDYSLHYFISREKILKSLTASLFTTICAFLILLFSGTMLLKQIAVFTICGLISVYAFVLLFYPKNLQFNCRKLFKLNPKTPILIVILCICLTGLFFTKYNDDITSLYVPSKKLLKAEKLYSNLLGGKNKTSFVVIDQKDLQKNLETEEKIVDKLKLNNYEALSKYIPSVKRQQENLRLISKAASTKNLNSALTPDEFPLKENFLINGNKTLMILYNFDNPQLLKEFDGIKYFSLSENISDIVKNLRQNCIKLLFPVFLIIFIILSLLYNPKNAIKLITPSLLSVLFTAGLLSVLGVNLNLFHILAFFLVIGFSLDYSIFGLVKKCSDAVLMSCMTSVFSFTLLALTSFKLISSIGFVLAVGLLCSYLLSIIIFGEHQNEMV